ncbi:MAG: hypothetical protein RLZZ387_1733 [Chloroflexota bacterium]
MMALRASPVATFSALYEPIVGKPLLMMLAITLGWTFSALYEPIVGKPACGAWSRSGWRAFSALYEPIVGKPHHIQSH